MPLRDDTNELINPDGIETCIGEDDDRNEVIDDDAEDDHQVDNDGDGYGTDDDSETVRDVPADTPSLVIATTTTLRSIRMRQSIATKSTTTAMAKPMRTMFRHTSITMMTDT